MRKIFNGHAKSGVFLSLTFDNKRKIRNRCFVMIYFVLRISHVFQIRLNLRIPYKTTIKNTWNVPNK